jgi:hypothetical protein
MKYLKRRDNKPREPTAQMSNPGRGSGKVPRTRDDDEASKETTPNRSTTEAPPSLAGETVRRSEALAANEGLNLTVFAGSTPETPGCGARRPGGVWGTAAPMPIQDSSALGP